MHARDALPLGVKVVTEKDKKETRIAFTGVIAQTNEIAMNLRFCFGNFFRSHRLPKDVFF